MNSNGLELCINYAFDYDLIIYLLNPFNDKQII